MPASSPIIVVGHKNPDNDAICAAVAYAHLKNELARRDEAAGRPASSYVPARLGPLPPETAWVLKSNGLPAPEIIGHIHARVLDVMTPTPSPSAMTPPSWRPVGCCASTTSARSWSRTTTAPTGASSPRA